jgi:hypothetical protein
MQVRWGNPTLIHNFADGVGFPLTTNLRKANPQGFSNPEGSKPALD